MVNDIDAPAAAGNVDACCVPDWSGGGTSTAVVWPPMVTIDPSDRAVALVDRLGQLQRRRADRRDPTERQRRADGVGER